VTKVSTQHGASGPGPQINNRRTYLILAAAAFVVGVFFRLWDLGGAPLAVDEYFFGTSILNIAEQGLPKFACAGYYTRGVLIQYLSLPLLSLGASLELTTRFWPAIASLLSIVAVWRIGLLAGGAKTAAIAVVLVSLSVWEVEFARFGRMYSPFQAIFLWYVYLQILHLVKGSNWARWGYLALSAVSIFVYAGASFLLLFNLLALVWPGKRWSIGHIIVASLLLILGVGYYTNDLRYFGVAPEAAPPTVDSGSSPSLPVTLPVLPDFMLPIVLVGLFFIGCVIWRYRYSFRVSHLSFIYWALAALCACFGLFGFGLGLMLAGLLMQLPSPLTEAGLWKKKIKLLLVAMLTVWLVVLMALFAKEGNLWTGVTNALLYILDYPDLYYYVVRPWIQTIPVTTVILLLLTPSQIWVLLVRQPAPGTEHTVVQKYIAAALILLLLLSAFFVQPYRITRYTYFLYPLILVLATTAIVYWSEALFRRPLTRTAATVAPIVLLFAFAEDFRIQHLAQINEPEIRFRTAYGDRLAAHYYTRWDFRSAASFVNEHVAPADAVVVFDQPLPHYLDRTSGIFIREGTENHRLVWGCGGRQDLWSNARLLDTEAEVRDVISETRGNVWLIMRTDAYRSRDPIEISLPAEYALRPEFITQDEHLVVYRIHSTNGGAMRSNAAPGTATVRATRLTNRSPAVALTCPVSA
jgi:hypothetical protein